MGMKKASFEKLVEQVKALLPDEQQQLRQALDGLPANASSPPTEDEFEQHLFNLGLLSEVKPPAGDRLPHESWKPVEIKGKPLSETIIEERLVLGMPALTLVSADLALNAA